MPHRLLALVLTVSCLAFVNADVVTNQRWTLRSRPKGDFRARDLVLKVEDIDESQLEDGEVLVEVDTLSIEAFYRTNFDAEAYHGSTDIGATAPALGIGRVLLSKSKKLKKGTAVLGMLGAQTYARVPAAGLQPAAALPGTRRTDVLGRMGISGLTAWIGMICVLGPPKRKEVVVVSASAGAVGCLAAQIAKARGAYVIGVAGGPKKCAYLMETLHLDGAIDYKSSEALEAQLDRLAPDGVDFFFDNVGGAILDAVLSKLKRDARIVICGGVSHYNKGHQNKGTVVGPSQYLKLAERGATMKGYNVMFYLPRKLPAFLFRMLWLIWRRKVRMDEHIEQGIGAYAGAVEKMFAGGHIGKLLIDVRAKGEA